MRRTGLLLLAALFSAGCGDSFDPPSYLKDLRVLAVTAEPLEVVVSGAAPGTTTVTATAYVHLPPDAVIAAESWRFCAASTGPYGGYACLFPEDCEVDLTDRAVRLSDGPAFSRVSLDVLALGAPCAARLAAEEGAGDVPGDGAPTAEAPAELVVDVLLAYRVETADGAARDAVLRLPVWLSGTPETPNRAPVIERVEWEGAAVAAGETVPAVAEGGKAALRVVVAEDSLDAYVDEAGRDRTEDPVISFFATAGRFELDRAVGGDTTTEWKARALEDDEAAAVVLVVVRDLRGGQALFGPFTVPIRRDAAP